MSVTPALNALCDNFSYPLKDRPKKRARAHAAHKFLDAEICANNKVLLNIEDQSIHHEFSDKFSPSDLSGSFDPQHRLHISTLRSRCKYTTKPPKRDIVEASATSNSSSHSNTHEGVDELRETEHASGIDESYFRQLLGNLDTLQDHMDELLAEYPIRRRFFFPPQMDYLVGNMNSGHLRLRSERDDSFTTFKVPVQQEGSFEVNCRDKNTKIDLKKSISTEGSVENDMVEIAGYIALCYLLEALFMMVSSLA